MRTVLKHRSWIPIVLACIAAIVGLLHQSGRLEAGPARGHGSPSPHSSTAIIDGQQGGQIKTGPWTVAVPAGAYTGKAKITLSVPNGSVLVCTLDIYPASANKFKLPVMLSMNGKEALVSNSSNLVMARLDPDTGAWTPLAGSVVSADGTVTAPLEHFSTYGCVEGKAGW